MKKMEYGPKKLDVFTFETSQSRDPSQFVKAMILLHTRDCMGCQLRASRIRPEYL